MTQHPTSGADYRFDLDLPKGQVAEKLLRDILCGQTTGTTVEVKRDYKVSTTGNVAIEYRSRGRNSGIAISKADWWAIAFSGPSYDDASASPEVIVLIKRSRLKKLLRILRDSGELRTVLGGDRATSEMALVPASELLRALSNIDV